MTQFFTITQPKSTLASSVGSELITAEFTVTNTAGRALDAGVRVKVDNDSTASWFLVKDGPEWHFSVDESMPVRVQINIPPDAEPGTRTFRIVMFSLEKCRADEDFAQSEAVSFEVKEAVAEKPRCRWCIPAAIMAVLVLSIGAWGLYELLKDEVYELPDYVGMSTEDAVSDLCSSGLSFKLIESFYPDSEPGTVIGQSPVAGESLVQAGNLESKQLGDLACNQNPDGIADVELIVSHPGVVVNKYVGMSYFDAVRLIIDDGLRTDAAKDNIRKTTLQSEINKVLEQHPAPAANIRVARGTVVQLTVGIKGGVTDAEAHVQKLHQRITDLLEREKRCQEELNKERSELMAPSAPTIMIR